MMFGNSRLLCEGLTSCEPPEILRSGRAGRVFIQALDFVAAVLAVSASTNAPTLAHAHPQVSPSFFFRCRSWWFPYHKKKNLFSSAKCSQGVMDPFTEALFVGSFPADSCGSVSTGFRDRLSRWPSVVGVKLAASNCATVWIVKNTLPLARVNV